MQPQSMIVVRSVQWSTGLWDCFDDLAVCCFASCCFPCFTCRTASELEECFCLPLLDSFCAFPQLLGIPSCVPPISLSMRAVVRKNYGIQGDLRSDCVISTCCNICSWCQIAREIKRRQQPLTIISAQPTVQINVPVGINAVDLSEQTAV